MDTGDYLQGSDLEVIFDLIEENLLDNDEDINMAMHAGVLEIEEDEDSTLTFSCEICEKVCKTKRGLSRHKNSRHTLKDSTVDSKSTQATRNVESILHPLQLKKMIEASISKLTKEECYPENILDELRSYSFNMDHVLSTYYKLKTVITSYSGNSELFYPSFYSCIAKEPAIFENLGRPCCLLVGFELANHVLAYLNSSNQSQDAQQAVCEKIDPSALSKKEKACIAYLSGYVFGTFYRRIRNSKQWNSPKSQQWLAILIAGKVENTNSLLNEANLLIAAKNRGGLWIVSEDVAHIFAIVECQFEANSKNISTKISCGELVNKLMRDCIILSLFSKLRNIADQKTDKEIALNLLEQLLTLYVRVRAFSYAKDKMQQHKMRNKKVKEQSLRTEIKKKSNNVDNYK